MAITAWKKTVDRNGDTYIKHQLSGLDQDGICVVVGDYDIKGMSWNNTTPGATTHVKMINNANPTLGTDEPDLMLSIPDNDVNSAPCNFEDVFTSALFIWATSTKASNAAQAAPTTGDMDTFTLYLQESS